MIGKNFSKKVFFSQKHNTIYGEVAMKKAVALILMLTSLTVMLIGCSNDEEIIIDSEYNQTAYDITLNISEDLEDITVATDIIYTNNTEDTLTSMGVYVYPLSYTEETEGRAYLYSLDKYATVENMEVKMNGEPAIYMIDSECSYIEISLGGGVMPEAEVTISISYNVSMPHTDLRFGLYDSTLSLGNFYPVVAVYENGAFRKDSYSRIGDPFYTEISDYNATITAASELVIATSGEKQSAVENDGTTTYEIVGENLRDFAISANYDYQVTESEYEGTKLYVYTTGEDGAEIMATAESAIAVFSEGIGAYQYSTYSVVETAFYYGGMEYGSLVVVSDDASNRDEVIIHETAHQWFQSVVGSDSINTPWLDEGLVTYLQDYYYIMIGDTETYNALRADCLTSYNSTMEWQRESYAEWSASMERTVYQYSTNLEYSLIAYTKGSMMFEAIMSLCGEKKFEKALQIYYANNAYGIATEESLIAAFKEANVDISSIVSAYVQDTVVTYTSTIFLR